MSSVTDKRTNNEYGYRQAVNPEVSYQDFIRGVPDSAIAWQNIQKHSEFKRPYDAKSYQDMEYRWDGLPGFNFLGGGPGSVDFDWQGPGPVPTPPGPEGGAPGGWWNGNPNPAPGDSPDPGAPPTVKVIVFDCQAGSKYLMCTTTEIQISCTQRCYAIRHNGYVPQGYLIDYKCNTITITAPGCDAGYDEYHEFSFTIEMIASNGNRNEQDIRIQPVWNSCDGVNCDHCINPVPYISHATQQMAVDGTQVLSVGDSNPSATYGWSITAGGGSLSDASGTTTTYTAPSSNAECAFNPTITLTCDGDAVATLQIAINGAALLDAYYIATSINLGICEWEIRKQGYNCAGGIYGASVQCAYIGVCDYPDPATCDCGDGTFATAAGIFDLCDPNSCGQVNGIYINCTGTTDIRTAAQKTNGCCPAALL